MQHAKQLYRITNMHQDFYLYHQAQTLTEFESSLLLSSGEKHIQPVTDKTKTNKRIK